MKSGEVFNPHGLFTGAWIPNVILQHPDLSPTAKLTWARLQQYAGKDGRAYPAIDTLAAELGISSRQTQRAVQELVNKAFIERILPSMGNRSRGGSSHYLFLWHDCFNGAKIRGEVQNPTDDISVVCKVGTDDKSGKTHDINVVCTDDISVTEQTTYLSPKDINTTRQNKEDTTTTTTAPEQPMQNDGSGGGCGGDACGAFPEEKKIGTEPSEESLQYIELKVAYQEEHGGFTKGKAAYKRALTSRARKGELDMDDLDDLLEWNNTWQRVCPTALTKQGWHNREVAIAWLKSKELSCDPQQTEKDKFAGKTKIIDNMHLDESRTRVEQSNKRHEECKAWMAQYIIETWSDNIPMNIYSFIEGGRAMRDDINHTYACLIIEELYPKEYCDANNKAVLETIREGKKKLGIASNLKDISA